MMKQVRVQGLNEVQDFDGYHKFGWREDHASCPDVYGVNFRKPTVMATQELMTKAFGFHISVRTGFGLS